MAVATRHPKALKSAVVAGAFLALAIPSMVSAQSVATNSGGSSNPCAGQSAGPNCKAPEVPLALLYPVAGAAVFGSALAYRAIRRVRKDTVS